MTIEDSIQSIELNAKRLLEDAKLLQENGRYKTSFSISILSIEEAGKACLLKWGKDGYLNEKLKRKDILNHKNKQKIFSTFVFIDSFLRAILELCDDEEWMSKVFNEYKVDKNGQNPAKHILKELTKEENKNYFELVCKKAGEKAHSLSITVESGGLDWLKQSGFYIDIDENLELVKAQQEFSIEDASEIIEFAERSISMIHKSDPLHVAMAAAYQANKGFSIPKFTDVVLNINDK
ncbi:MAG: AbiV family abortive infection protein [Proteobacteria bacterium]|nr:AbiV family abortive infection protein [Pseudomonadota bacterium]